MGLIDRIVRTIRAQIYSLFGKSKSEDPERLLEITLMDMMEDLVCLRQALAGGIAAQKRTEREYERAQSTADKWYKRAMLALQKGDKIAARKASSERNFSEEKANTIKTQLDRQTLVVENLKKNLIALETKISYKKNEKNMYTAIAREAVISKRLQKLKAFYIRLWGLIDRIVRTIRAQIYSLFGKSEDPERLLEMALIEMREELIQLRKAVAGAIATQKCMKQEYHQAQATADDCYKQAHALQKEDEIAARKALSRRNFYKEKANTIKTQLDRQTLVLENLKKNLTALETKIVDASTKKNMYAAYTEIARAAVISKRLNQKLEAFNILYDLLKSRR